MENMIIGIDLGGTNLRIGAVNNKHNLIKPLVLKSECIASSPSPISTLCKLIEEYLCDTNITHIDAISIGVPSSVENDNATVICTTNIRNQSGEAVFSHVNIAENIKKHFHVPVFVNNDVNNLMLYDTLTHHLEDKKVLVGIYIGTGVGASVIINGDFLKGKNGAALDLGHIPYYGKEELCSCGKKGCCECYASGWRLQQIRKEYYPDSPISELFTLHKTEEPLLDFVSACANIYAIMATIFNPDALIIGGGIPEMKDFPKDQFEKEINASVGKDVLSYGFDVIYSTPFVGKGIIGAAIFARKMLLKS